MRKFSFISVFAISIVASVVVFSCEKKPDPVDPPPTEEPKEKENIFVSKEPSTKNVLLEEYTGDGCGYCPYGHKISDEMAEKYSGQYFAINIHAGFTASAHKTPIGVALDTLFKIDKYGYPAGVINREKTTSSGFVYARDRGAWENYAKQILAKDAYVNVAAESTIEQASRKLTVNVQAYFTNNSDVPTNYINVVIVQNNILGYQNNMSVYSEMVVGSKYKHNHMFRDAITGINGEAMDKNEKNYLYSKTFTYDIPETISKTNVVLEDLEIIVFVTEDTPANAKTIIPRVVNVNKSSIVLK